MVAVIERIEVILLIAAIVAMLARRIRLPYTVALVLAGIGISAATGTQPFQLTKDLIFTAFLPPLVFEAAIQLDWKKLRTELVPVSILATAGVILSAVIVAFGLHWVVGWPPAICAVVAVMLSATDPVAVIAAFKDLRIRGRLQMLVESESLFNDGTAAVLFGIALTATNGSFSASVIPLQFLWISLGGTICGAVVAYLGLFLAGRTDDHLVEITFTSVVAYSSFLLAEHFHLSGVLATLTAGVILGNVGSLGAISDKGREAVHSFWEYIAFVSNSIIFILIGGSLNFHRLASVWPLILLTIGLLLLGRAVSVYGCLLFLGRSKYRVESRYQHVLFWGGLRGALALALALGLPAEFEHRDEILSVTFGVVTFSVIVQGVTMPALLRRLKIQGAPVG